MNALLASLRVWGIMSFAVVVIALFGWITVAQALISVVALTMLGIFVFRVNQQIALLQLSVQLIFLLVISGGIGAFAGEVMEIPAAIAGVVG